MASRALRFWNTVRLASVGDMLGAAGRLVGPGSRRTRRRILHASTVLLAAEFQGFCRDLHSEAVEALVSVLADPRLATVVWDRFLRGRPLDRGNPSPAAIRADCGVFGGDPWQAMARVLSAAGRLRAALESLLVTRNAVAHSAPTQSGGPIRLRTSDLRRWRAGCDRLARALADVIAERLTAVTGRRPW